VSDRKGTEKFYINTHPDSSSIFPPSPRAFFEQRPGDEGDLTWQANTILDRIVEVPTTTIDDVVREDGVPPPDMLSIDAQGAEYKILKGAAEALRTEVLLVITEVEFHRIYDGQPLFSEQFDLLYSNGFRLAEIFAQQYWHPLARAGYGLLTVGEALFLRDPEEFLAVEGVTPERQMQKIAKIAVLAFLFGRLSVVTHTVNLGIKHFGQAFVDKINESTEYAVILSVRDYINDNLDEYLKNPRFFDESDYLISRYGPVEELGRPSLRKIPTYPYVPVAAK
jgi:FkbM family methyltransferase